MIFNAAPKQSTIIPSLPEYILHHQIFLRNKYPYAAGSDPSSSNQIGKSLPLKTIIDYLDSTRREMNEYIRSVNSAANLDQPPIRNIFTALISYVISLVIL
jgi:hypothetical protein